MSALATLTASAVCCVLGDEQVDEQIRLRDDIIVQLKQQIAAQQQQISDLEYRIEDPEGHPSQASIKEEGIHVYMPHHCSVLASSDFKGGGG